MRVILLYRNKVKIYDRSMYFKLYGGVSKEYNSMIKGAPLLLNINGTLVDIRSISKAVVHKRDQDKADKYVANVLSVSEPAMVKFKLI